ncbi:putative secreted protein [Piscirickettsia salmonis]|uniref:protease inhibitor I42 family protein n=1 Tax=Piscirickettsia salmonis TaxID=1238 RepID=UPI0012B87959|nr:protease inhibitor I42 family protein [Piscirickettsia salmonis]QGP51169.1 putative secreted protein [Piscirickettsia salmonis]
MKISQLIRHNHFVISISSCCLLLSFLATHSTNYAATINTNTNNTNTHQSFTQAFNNSKALVVSKPGQTFEIKVPANPTTGFSWFLKSYDHDLLDVINQRYDAPKTNMIGAPGKDIWTFKAKPMFFTAPQITVIELYNARPFDIRKGQVLKLALVSQPSAPNLVKNNLK